MSAIDRLRDVVAIHSLSATIAWPRADLVAVLQEIDELSQIGLDWSKRAREAEKALAEWEAGTRYTRSSDGFDMASALSPLLLKGEPGIELTPAQLVQIIREAGKP